MAAPIRRLPRRRRGGRTGGTASAREWSALRPCDVIGVGRRSHEDEEFRDTVIDSIERFSRRRPDNAVLEGLLSELRYVQGSFDDDAGLAVVRRTTAEYELDAGRQIRRRPRAAMTRGLNRNERLIIILYYYEDMTMKEIGATLDLSESRVSQMHSSIVARLQAQLAKRQPEFAA